MAIKTVWLSKGMIKELYRLKNEGKLWVILSKKVGYNNNSVNRESLKFMEEEYPAGRYFKINGREHFFRPVYKSKNGRLGDIEYIDSTREDGNLRGGCHLRSFYIVKDGKPVLFMDCWKERRKDEERQEIRRIKRKRA